MRVDIPVGLHLLFGTSLLCCVEEDCTNVLVREVFDDSDKVGADVVFFIVAHKATSQTLSKAFFFFRSVKT